MGGKSHMFESIVLDFVAPKVSNVQTAASRVFLELQLPFTVFVHGHGMQCCDRDTDGGGP
jgi:hypothetical protein